MGYPGDVLGNVQHSLVKVADGGSNHIFFIDVGWQRIDDTKSYRDIARCCYFRHGIGELEDERKISYCAGPSVISSLLGFELYRERAEILAAGCFIRKSHAAL